MTAATGGRGGNAEVEGNNSTAEGGKGGEAVVGDGGRGGDARVVGNDSMARGGFGGRGGLGPGSPGGDAEVLSDNALAFGGQGGEASQPGGRGGRGGRAPGLDYRRAHMRWPYGEPITEPGRGGDAPDTPQYMARRLIIEDLKAQFFQARALPLDEVWWDREIVPLDWLNERLSEDEHRWRVRIVDWEYEFSDFVE